MLMKKTKAVFYSLVLIVGWIDCDTMTTGHPDMLFLPSLGPPFHLQIIQAGGVGVTENLCKINWLYPEPSSESTEYEIYIVELQNVERKRDFNSCPCFNFYLHDILSGGTSVSGYQIDKESKR